eukprot:04413.XXX_105097_105204_1 [CDS] Oithona nana genome sequencing.
MKLTFITDLMEARHKGHLKGHLEAFNLRIHSLQNS